jgi:hypothetical protein
MALTTGCASGGFKLTRQYAGWVNSQNIILRIVLYILTSVVFAVTLLIDAVVFNTMDFWEGRVSQGTYEFKDATKTYQVRHEFQPGTQLKRSTIQIKDLNQARLQEIVLSETASGEIEMFIDGKLRTRVHSISEAPVASIFDGSGKLVDEHVVLIAPTMAMAGRPAACRQAGVRN